MAAPLAATKALIDAIVASGHTPVEAAGLVETLTQVIQAHGPDKLLTIIALLEKTRDSADQVAALAKADTEVAKLPRKEQPVKVR